MEIRVVPDPTAVAAEVAERMAAAIDGAVAEHGVATVAFSGGATPAPMLRALSQRPLPWDSVHVFQVDERLAPDGHPDRNATMLRAELLDRVGAQAHLMPVTAEDLQQAAGDYAALLADLAGGVLDVVHLGLGPDGHTASLVPGDPVLHVTDRDVALTGEYQGRRRMTLTYPALDRARLLVWEIVGDDKADAVRSLVDQGDVPAGGVSQARAVLVTDQAAAIGDRQNA
ncbi:MAG: 6-phosphogluconolactonase [Euzebyaceae bacterium]|jgi:6-phosphogluconolactonase|nr:6-phosphogluconolactonase [Euzebyaceae bacterium]